MRPSSEVGEASGEETGVGIGETLEGVVTTMDAMTSVVEAVEAMVSTVEMLECLVVGRPETERTSAARFFSRTLACQVDLDDPLISFLPLYWPGRLPRLIPLLTDCLRPHNSEIIQSDAILSLKHLGDATTLLLQESDHNSFTSLPVYKIFKSHTWGYLLRLADKADCPEIRNQAGKALGTMAAQFPADYHKYLCDIGWYSLPLTSALVRKYAAILKPTGMEMRRLNYAMEVLIKHCDQDLDDVDLGHISDILPVIASLFQEPGDRKEAQFQAAVCLRDLSSSDYDTARILLIDQGVLGMVLETLRVGKESPDVLFQIFTALYGFLASQVTVESALNLGAMDALHKALKRPNVVFSENRWTPGDSWSCALFILSHLSGEMPVRQKAILSEEGLVERVLELGMELKLENMTETTELHHQKTVQVVKYMTTLGSDSQKRRLMQKSLFLRLLARYLSAHGFPSLVEACLVTVEACLAVPGSPEGLRLRRLLIDNSGITDAVRDINSSSRFTDHWFTDLRAIASHILDTYLKDPLPPLPPTHLPTVIYTRNAPY